MNGEELLTIASQHIGERYILGAFAPKNNANWHGPWDCAEFASWGVFQVASRLYGCNVNNINPALADAYTGYWVRDAQNVGQRINVDAAARIPGAAVLRVPRASALGHIVFSDGRGGTVEAHSRAKGVRRDTLNGRRWDMGILVPGIEYASNGNSVVVSPAPLIYRLTSPFMRGETVRRIQSRLSEVGFDPGSIDGIFGPQTLAAVYAFQLAEGLVSDGEVGPETANALGVSIS